jgi:transposase
VSASGFIIRETLDGGVRRAPRIVLSTEDIDQLEAWARSSSPTDRRARRARIVLAASAGGSNGQIARSIGVRPETVALWRGRFAAHGIEGVRRDAPRPGSGRRAPAGVVDRIIRTTLEVEPPQGRWTTRSLASALNVNHMLVYRVWKSRGLAPSTGRGIGPVLTVRKAEPAGE